MNEENTKTGKAEELKTKKRPIKVIFPLRGVDDKYINVQDKLGPRKIARRSADFIILETVPKTVEIAMSVKYAKLRAERGELTIPKSAFDITANAVMDNVV